MSKRRHRRSAPQAPVASANPLVSIEPVIPKPVPPHNVTPKPAPPKSSPSSRVTSAAANAIRKKSKPDGTKRDGTKRDGTKRDGPKLKTNIARSESAAENSGVKSFIGSRTTKRRREDLPTDWPSKPNPRDHYEWFTTGDGPTINDVAHSGINVYVPIPAATGLFSDRCAIIGTLQGGSNVLVDVEDGRYSPAPYVDLVERAYGRHSTGYPTVARMVIGASLLVKVGSYDPELGIVTIDDIDSFAMWTGTRSAKLLTSDGLPARRRQWATFLEQRPDVAHVPALRRAYARHFHLES